MLPRSPAALLLGLALSGVPAAGMGDDPPSAKKPAVAAPETGLPAVGVAWRAARWGMSPAEVVAAFPGEAFLQEPPVTLPDGSVLGAGINGHAWEGLTVNVRFVFTGGKLALVSLRTEQNRYADPAAYDRVRKALVARWGEPVETTSDGQFIDMRQTRWNRGADRADLKYIPGVVAIIHYPRPAAQ